jgi:hypothetical protein
MKKIENNKKELKFNPVVIYIKYVNIRKSEALLL